MSETANPGGERKQVTVLFADVQGSMDLAEQQDPEQWHAIMQRFFATLADAVHRFEGTVDKFTGDGIMAVFGAPIAHEDHARRACYAALKMLDDVGEYAAELRRGHGLNFSTRIGINSGEVVAAEVGEGGYTAVGHTVGLAQRMEALAEPGKAYLTESTAGLAHGFMELADLGQFEIKGSSHPVGVFELAGVGSARSRLDLSRERGFSRFVGRDEEMATLDAALGQAERGEGAAIGIVAEPGVGKSRLCHEFAERCRERGVEVFECQAQAHGRTIPFMPVLQMLRSYFGIADGDPERIVREKIAGRTLLLDPDFAEELPLLFDFLGVPDPDRPLPQLSAEARQRALRSAVCRLVRAPNRRDSIVALVEDLHWMDEGSATLLGELISSVEGTQTLAIVNFRPEYDDAAWARAETYRPISLEPLGPAGTQELLRDLVGEDPSLDGLGELIHERTAGNPFFVEEIVRGLAEAGNLEGERGAYRLARPVEDTGVPASVQTILAARIDRLGPAAKRLLQAASVAPKEISERALVMVSGQSEDEDYRAALCELTDGGFLFETEVYPERAFAFRHPLTREVAYGTQLAEQRAASHAATARALIELNPDRHDEMAALIASHMEAGGEALEAARWSARAAYWAGGSRPQDALRLWRRTMELTEALEESEESLAMALMSRLQQLDFAWRLGMDDAEEARLTAEAEEIARRTGDLHSLAMLRVARDVRPGMPHIAADWMRAAAETVEIADRSGDRHLRIAIRAASSFAYLCSGEFEEFRRALDEILDLAAGDRRAGARIVIGSPVAWATMAKGLYLRERGHLDEAEGHFSAALQIATEDGDPEIASWTRSNQALMLSMRGEFDAALALARRNCELTERLGDVFSRSLALANLGGARIAAGDYAGALESLEEAERVTRAAASNGDEMETWRAGLRAQALIGIGRSEEGLELAEWAAAVARERGMLWSLPVALQAIAIARAATGREGVETALDEAAEVAERTGATISLQAVETTRETLVPAR
ncbi:MAG TPA: adenylate/guanylate cyclase domain-containing protein [Solirubrobacterales bacterium]|nr:adenylate/guanylate cyclase domain-containing protein [Solirubrobacterales bacterium]